ncbi:hypothetical protein AMTR_s00062p00187810 [Amborella trichopoda]|uniref:Uncharacterized protein n=1 Tax=Amborella trichopoda TaxID=13333 RepID=U5DAZ1_AMBTC|nr:hypothetical protein AMTR_s00062p00187810 [Amborella trichopoda]
MQFLVDASNNLTTVFGEPHGHPAYIAWQKLVIQLLFQGLSNAYPSFEVSSTSIVLKSLASPKNLQAIDSSFQGGETPPQPTVLAL